MVMFTIYCHFYLPSRFNPDPNILDSNLEGVSTITGKYAPRHFISSYQTLCFVQDTDDALMVTAHRICEMRKWGGT